MFDTDADLVSSPRVETGSANERWRVFCALDMPVKVSQQASEHLRKLRNRFPEVNAGWNRDGRFHLTLKFLGEITPLEAEAFSKVVANVAADSSPFNIVVKDTGAFPQHGPPRVLWIGVIDSSGKLGRVQQSLEEECSRIGFEREERQFYPHLTVVRMKKGRDSGQASRNTQQRALVAASKEIGFGPIEVVVRELIVFRSQPRSAGSDYSVISRHSFNS